MKCQSETLTCCPIPSILYKILQTGQHITNSWKKNHTHTIFPFWTNICAQHTSTKFLSTCPRPNQAFSLCRLKPLKSDHRNTIDTQFTCSKSSFFVMKITIIHPCPKGLSKHNTKQKAMSKTKKITNFELSTSKLKMVCFLLLTHQAWFKDLNHNKVTSEPNIWTKNLTTSLSHKFERDACSGFRIALEQPEQATPTHLKKPRTFCSSDHDVVESGVSTFPKCRRFFRATSLEFCGRECLRMSWMRIGMPEFGAFLTFLLVSKGKPVRRLHACKVSRFWGVG